MHVYILALFSLTLQKKKNADQLRIGTFQEVVPEQMDTNFRLLLNHSSTFIKDVFKKKKNSTKMVVV